MLSLEEKNTIKNNFGFHPRTPETVEKYCEIRTEIAHFAIYVCDMIPPSRERSLFLTNLQQAEMWAIAAIAVNETPLSEE